MIAVAVGIAALRLGERAEPFLGFGRSALAVIQKMLWWTRFAPIGTLGLIGDAVADYGWENLGPLGAFALASTWASPSCCSSATRCSLRLHGLSPLRYFSGVWPAVQLAFVCRSSIGTLPLTERVTERNLGVPRSTHRSPCRSARPRRWTAAQRSTRHRGDLRGPVLRHRPRRSRTTSSSRLVSVVGSAATAGITGATVMLTLTLSTLGLPLEGVGLLLAIDPILDMGRTAINVAGQALVPTIVAKREGILDVERYASTPTVDPVAPAGAREGLMHAARQRVPLEAEPSRPERLSLPYNSKNSGENSRPRSSTSLACHSQNFQARPENCMTSARPRAAARETTVHSPGMTPISRRSSRHLGRRAGGVAGLRLAEQPRRAARRTMSVQRPAPGAGRRAGARH